MIFAANLKCNHTRSSFAAYAARLNEAISGELAFKFENSENEILVFPPFPALAPASEFKFEIGAQNFYPCENGSFTGEIGAEMLGEFGVKTVLVGHSERRALGEGEELLRRKFDFARKKGWRVVYCIGEDLATRKSGRALDFLARQLANVEPYENLVVAYEPIWAIGTGISADANDVAEALAFLATKTSAPLLYGGSVKPANIAELAQIPQLSGVLVGTASWDAENFIKLIKG